MRKKIEIAIKILIYITFFVPLLVIPASFIFPFIVPKILLFRSLVTLMVGCYALLLIINWQEYKPKFTALNLVVAAFLLSFTISTFFGTDPYHSFWDNHERMLGLFTISHYIAYYFVATVIFKNWTDWKWALRVFLVAGSIAMIIGILQKLADCNLLLNLSCERVASTLGNSIYVGGYGLFLFFISSLLYLKEKNTVGKVVIAIAGLASVLGLFYSGSRGAIFGFLVGFAVLIVGYLIIWRSNSRVRLSLSAIIILMFAGVALIFVFKDSEFVQARSGFNRLANTSLDSVVNSARWKAWTIAVQSWKDHPFFGWGPNNYFYAFNLHYKPQQLEHGYAETWFDNAHNIILNTLAVQGLFGIITYLGIFVIGVMSLVYARRSFDIEPHVVVVGIAFLFAHLAGNVTVFENPTSYLYFMFWLAMVNSLSSKREGPPPASVVQKNLDSDKRNSIIFSATIVAVCCFVVIFVFNIQPARANMGTLNVLRLLSQNPILATLEMKKVFDFPSPHIDDIRSDIGRSAAQLLYSSRDKLGVDKSKEIWGIVYNELQKNLTLHPLDIRNQISLSQLAQVGAEINNNGQYYLEAEGFLEDALRHSPKRQQVIYSLAGIKSLLGKNDEAISLLEQTIVDDPNIPEGYWRLAFTYQAANQGDKAMETISRANDNGMVWDEQGEKVVGQIIQQNLIAK